MMTMICHHLREQKVGSIIAPKVKKKLLTRPMNCSIFSSCIFNAIFLQFLNSIRAPFLFLLTTWTFIIKNMALIIHLSSLIIYASLKHLVA